MSNVSLTKRIVFLIFFVSYASIIMAQDGFSLRGQYLLDKRPVVGTVVTVYEGSNVVAQAATNKLGKFSVSLEFQKSYVLQFKKNNNFVQKVVISTQNGDAKSALSKSKVVVFSLTSSKKSKEGPGTGDAVTTFHLDNNGMLVQKKKNVVTPIAITEEVTEIDSFVEDLQEEMEITIAEIPDTVEKERALTDYLYVRAKMDTLLAQATRKAELILADAQYRSDEMTKDAMQQLSSAKKKNALAKARNEKSLKNDLKKFAVEEKTFLARQDVKTFQKKMDVLSAKKMSPKDSVEFLSNFVMLNEELIESAKLQLEIDKLSAKTKEDSISLQQREAQIMLAEQEIKEAKNRIAIQEMEIKQKNMMLMFVIAAFLFLAILFVMVYRSSRAKKRTNAILEKQNNEIANKNKKILDSIRYAQTIQQAILPIKVNIDKHFDWFVIFQPKDIVSGDFYWFHHFEDMKKSVFAVVDCTGHGVPGAFMSLIGSRLLVQAIKEKKITDPVKILEEIDGSLRIALMQDETSNNDGMDLCICTIEYQNNGKCKVDYAGAKRPLLYTNRKDKKIEYIKGTVRGIGGKKRIREKPKKPFQNHSIMIDKGEVLYLTTDGFFDLQSPNRKKFGRQNFMTLVEQQFENSLPEQKDAIMEALHMHKGSEFQIDDVTILGIKL